MLHVLLVSVEIGICGKQECKWLSVYTVSRYIMVTSHRLTETNVCVLLIKNIAQYDMLSLQIIRLHDTMFART